jgi:hypothetical protein
MAGTLRALPALPARRAVVVLQLVHGPPATGERVPRRRRFGISRRLHEGMESCAGSCAGLPAKVKAMNEEDTSGRSSIENGRLVTARNGRILVAARSPPSATLAEYDVCGAGLPAGPGRAPTRPEPPTGWQQFQRDLRAGLEPPASPAAGAGRSQRRCCWHSRAGRRSRLAPFTGRRHRCGAAVRS